MSARAASVLPSSVADLGRASADTRRPRLHRARRAAGGGVRAARRRGHHDADRPARRARRCRVACGPRARGRGRRARRSARNAARRRLRAQPRAAGDGARLGSAACRWRSAATACGCWPPLGPTLPRRVRARWPRVLAEARAAHALCVVDAGCVRHPAAEPALAGADVVVWVADPARLDPAPFALAARAAGARGALGAGAGGGGRFAPRSAGAESAPGRARRGGRAARPQGARRERAPGGRGAAGAGGARMTAQAIGRRELAQAYAALVGVTLLAALVAAVVPALGGDPAGVVRVRPERATVGGRHRGDRARELARRSVSCCSPPSRPAQRRTGPAARRGRRARPCGQRRAGRAGARRLRVRHCCRGSRTSRSSGRRWRSGSPPTCARDAGAPGSRRRQRGRARRRAARCSRPRSRRGRPRWRCRDARAHQHAGRASWRRRSPSPRRGWRRAADGRRCGCG